MKATTTGGQNRIMIFGPKSDGTYPIEFKTAAGESLAISIPGSEAAPRCCRLCPKSAALSASAHLVRTYDPLLLGPASAGLFILANSASHWGAHRLSARPPTSASSSSRKPKSGPRWSSLRASRRSDPAVAARHSINPVPRMLVVDDRFGQNGPSLEGPHVRFRRVQKLLRERAVRRLPTRTPGRQHGEDKVRPPDALSVATQERRTPRGKPAPTRYAGANPASGVL
jgi:hypothetical protein